MNKPAVEFQTFGNRLHLIYRPRDGADWVHRKFDETSELVIKGTFRLTREQLIQEANVLDDEGVSDVDLGSFDLSDETDLSFVIAELDGDYYRFDDRVLPVGVPVLLAKDAKPTWKWFSAERKVSILQIIASLKPSRIVIGGMADDAIPQSEYERLINQLPTPHELRRYVQARTAAIVRQYTDAKVDAESMLHAYVDKRIQGSPAELADPFREADIAKYEYLLRHLEKMLDSEDGYSEAAWQAEILQIVRLLNPKYIAAFPTVPVRDTDSNAQRFMDMLLVDASGNVDVIEIKRPFEKCVVTSAVYRDNHVPLRELSGTVMQIEKYLRHLNRSGREGEVALRKHFGDSLPSDLEIRITNPCGIVIMGRDKGLSPAQLRDFEITRRHYKHIADIVTYDDLLRRLRTVLSQLKAGT